MSNLLELLPPLDEAAFAVCIQAAALHVRGDGDRVDTAAIERLGLGRKTQRAVLKGCVEVLSAASQAPPAKVVSRLRKKGFSDVKVDAVLAAVAAADALDKVAGQP